MAVELVESRLVHVGPIATNMREFDRRECAALGRSPKDALRGGLRSSLSVFTAVAEGRPIAMLGVVPVALMGGKGTIWMLGTEEVYRKGRAMLHLGPPVFDLWLETFSRLENIIMTDNTRAIRLLKRWGFKFGDDTRIHGGETFVPFWMDRAIQPPAAAP